MTVYYIYAVDREGKRWVLRSDGWFTRVDNFCSDVLRYHTKMEAVGALSLLKARDNVDGKTVDLLVSEETKLYIGDFQADEEYKEE